MADVLFKTAVAVLDERTTVICLNVAGQIVGIDRPFRTLNGEFYDPPFHISCRTMVDVYMPGMTNSIRRQANTLLQKLPQKLRNPVKARKVPFDVKNPPVGHKFVLPDDLSKRLDKVARSLSGREKTIFKGMVTRGTRAGATKLERMPKYVRDRVEAFERHT